MSSKKKSNKNSKAPETEVPVTPNDTASAEEAASEEAWKAEEYVADTEPAQTGDPAQTGESNQAEAPALVETHVKAPDNSTPATKNAPPKKKKALWKKILSNPLFWLAVSIILLICAIEYFERYTQIGINNTYKIF